MLDWFYLKDIRLTEDNDKTSIHIYLDENETTPDERTDLRPNGFTRESVSMLKPHAFAGDPKKYQNVDGIVLMDVFDFLLDKESV